MRPGRFWTQHFQLWWRRLWGRPPDIPDRLWQHVLAQHQFLSVLSPADLEQLRGLSSKFLASKEFHGAHGLRITDTMALSIAAQACLPLLHWGSRALSWYDDFVVIVVHAAEAVAQRTSRDEAGVVHHYREALIGEAMAGGPVMLAWSHVSAADDQALSGRNLVIHEFAHKLDMHGKPAHRAPDGCPMLPPGFMGHAQAATARHVWQSTLLEEYERFRQKVEMAVRFAGTPPWLDSYGAQAPAEFFAVTCEAYFVNRQRFAQEFPRLLKLFDALFRPERQPARRS